MRLADFRITACPVPKAQNLYPFNFNGVHNNYRALNQSTDI
jgi:hypothetical protein